MSRIKHSYLMWIGTEHYANFDEYANEAKELGVSKRLPSVAMGRTLLEAGSVVFVAHDDGDKQECRACRRKIPCPECRKRRVKLKELEKDLERFRSQFVSAAAIEESGFARRSVKIRQEKIEVLEKERDSCVLCHGVGKAKLGSGGFVTLTNGKVWDYRTFNYWLHQPHKFDADSRVLDRDMCEKCAGLGTIPLGLIRGMFLPERIEYILKGTEGDSSLEKLEGFEFVESKQLKKEAGRKCGLRKPGGIYAVTSVTKANIKAIKTIKELEKNEVIEEGSSDVFGSFVIFHNPIAIPGIKRFRGIAKWNPYEDAQDQAQQVLDVYEDE